MPREMTHTAGVRPSKFRQPKMIQSNFTTLLYNLPRLHSDPNSLESSICATCVPLSPKKQTSTKSVSHLFRTFRFRNMPSPYPSRQKITEIFASLAEGKYPDFFAHVSDDVDWYVMGQHPLAGQYHNKTDFQKQTFGRLSGIMKAPVQLKVRNVIGGGEEEWAVVELIADSTCKNGEEDWFLCSLSGGG